MAAARRRNWQWLGGMDDSALDAAIDAALAVNAVAVLFDATGLEHLARIGRVIWQRALRRAGAHRALARHWRAVERRRCRDNRASGRSGICAGRQPIGDDRAPDRCRVRPARRRRAAVPPRDPGRPRNRGAAGRIGGIGAVLRPIIQPGPRSARAHGARKRRRACDAGGREGPRPAARARVLELAPSVRRAGVAGGDSSSFAVKAARCMGARLCRHVVPGRSADKAARGCAAAKRTGADAQWRANGSPDLFEQLLRAA